MSKTATIIAFMASDISYMPEGATLINGIVWSYPDAWAGPRPKLEHDFRFRQIIPYVIVKHGDKVLTYVRNSAGNEERLHNRGSIGVGGHIDATDAQFNPDGSINVAQTILGAAVREVSEELALDVEPSEFKHVGFLKVSETEVDKVHFGVVLVLDITGWGRDAMEFEDTMSNSMFLTKEQLTDPARNLELETWSRLALAFV